MSEEEKKAIKECDIIFMYLEDMMSEESANDYRASYQIMKNLIDKQQKEIEIWKETENDYEHEIARKDEEIEKLKERNENLIEAIEEWVNGERINDIKHISKDKIRELINKRNAGIGYTSLECIEDIEKLLEE